MQLRRRQIRHLRDALERRHTFSEHPRKDPAPVQQVGKGVLDSTVIGLRFGLGHEDRQPERDCDAVRISPCVASTDRHVAQCGGDYFRIDADHGVHTVCDGPRGGQHLGAAGIDVDRNGRPEGKLGSHGSTNSLHGSRHLRRHGCRPLHVFDRGFPAADRQAGPTRRKLSKCSAQGRQHSGLARHRVRDRREQCDPGSALGSERESHEHVPPGMWMVRHTDASKAQFLGPFGESG